MCSVPFSGSGCFSSPLRKFICVFNAPRTASEFPFISCSERVEDFSNAFHSSGIPCII